MRLRGQGQSHFSMDEDFELNACITRSELMKKKRSFFYLILCLLSLGTFYMMSNYFLSWKYALTLKKVDCISKATHILVYFSSGPPALAHLDFTSSGHLIIIVRFKRYIYSPEKKLFVPLSSEKSPGVEDLKGHTNDSASFTFSLFGKNSLELPERSIPVLIIEEIQNPFYIFQWSCIILWVYDDYYGFAALVLLVSFLFIGQNVYVINRNQQELKKLTKTETRKVKVVRRRAQAEGEAEENSQEAIMLEVSPEEIVPGDLFVFWA